MKHLLRLSGLACCLIVAPLASLFAQETAPSMTLVLSSTDRLKEDVKFMLDLTTPAEQKQWEVIEEYLDEVFLLGLDGKRPHRYDLISGDNGVEYRSSFPIAKEADFRKNLGLFGIKLSRRTKTYYKLSEAFDGVLRFMDDYGVIGQSQDVPARGFTPLDAIMQKYALKPGTTDAIHDLMFLLLNDSGKPKDRQAAFAKVKKELMAAVKQAEGESEADFNLRRSLTELQIDEMGRYYTDPKELLIGWTLDTKVKQGSGLIDLLPEEGTPLADAVSKLATVPSRYEAIPEPEGKIFSFRLNLPLDELQTGNMVEVVNLVGAQAKANADTSETLKDEQKQALKQAVTLLTNSMTNTIKQKRLDGYVQCRPSQNGKYTLIGGAQFQNAANLTAAIKQIQIARPDRAITLDVGEHAGMAIHEIQVSEADEPQYDDFCGSNKFHIAVGEHEFWYSIGTDSIDALKAAIDVTNENKNAAANEEFFSLYLKPAPWVEWRARHAKPADPKLQKVAGATTPEGDAKKVNVDLAVIRKQAIEAFKPGDDVLIMSLTREEDRVKGNMSVDTGILRLVGKMTAQFSKDTLEE